MVGGSRSGTPNWTWNRDCEKPTLKPSVLTNGANAEGLVVCHSWVEDGEVHFLADCSHSLAGKSVPLLDVVEITTEEIEEDRGWTSADEDWLEEIGR
jgi:hypothetical protein